MAPTPVNLLQLSPTMTEGTIVKWLVQEGEKVEDGQAIAEVETDKAVMEQTTFEEGVLLKIVAKEGDKVKVEDIIAVVGEEGDDPNAVLNGSAPAAAPAEEEEPKAEAPAEEASAAEAKTESARPEPAGEPAGPEGDRVLASPLARKMAKDAGLDIAQIQGTGPSGRVIKADIEKASKEAPAAQSPAADAPQPAAPASIPQTSAALAEEVQLSGMRQTIARRLTESKQQVPHFQVSIDVRGEKLLEAVERIRAANPDHKVTVTHFLVKAMANVQMRHKAVRSQWAGDKFHVVDGAHISVAVAIEEGLLTPVLRDADRKGVLQIGQELRQLANLAKERKLTAEDMSGGTQTISNLGMFGTKEFTAIINPPESSILAIGAMEDRPVVENGVIVPGKVMTITASFDHRVIDGAVGAQYLQDLKAALEEPLMMLL